MSNILSGVVLERVDTDRVACSFVHKDKRVLMLGASTSVICLMSDRFSLFVGLPLEKPNKTITERYTRYGFGPFAVSVFDRKVGS